MKHLLKITSAVLVLLLCALGGVFLWRSGFFAALSSQQALQDYISQFAPYSHLCFFLLQFLHFLFTFLFLEIINVQMLFMCTFLFPFNSTLHCDFCQHFFFMIYPLIQFCIMLISALKSKTF